MNRPSKIPMVLSSAAVVFSIFFAIVGFAIGSLVLGIGWTVAAVIWALDFRLNVSIYRIETEIRELQRRWGLD